MRLQEQIEELKKVIVLLERSKTKRLEGGKHTEVELNYQISCLKNAQTSLERLLKLREQVQQSLKTLNEFDFEMIQ